MTSFAVNYNADYPPYALVFDLLTNAIEGLPEAYANSINPFVPIVRRVCNQHDVFVVKSDPSNNEFDTVVTVKDLSVWYSMLENGYQLNIVGKRKDGTPASADERRLRRMLCAAHDPRSYMDDGEAQSTSGLDFMRTSMPELAEAMMREKHLKFSNQLKQLHEVGITTAEPFDPVHELDGVLTEVEAGKPFDIICLRTIQRVRNYLSIVSNRDIRQGQL